MPQMAPLSWLLLFILFSTTLVIFNTLNYFCFLPLSPQMMSTKNITSISLKWKW